MIWLGLICAILGYCGGLFAPYDVVRMFCLLAGLPGAASSLWSMVVHDDIGLLHITVFVLNAVLCAAVLFVAGFFLWMWIAAGPATI